MIEPYRLSFTFGGLLFPESVLIAQRYLAVPDWTILKVEAQQGVLLRKTRASSRYRYFREIRDRLSKAWPFEIQSIAHESSGARYAAFAICCRHYLVIGDFVREVIQDKMAMKASHIGFDDYYHFLESKAPTHPELATLTETTRAKLRQVTFRMLTEGMLLEKGRDHRIQPPRIPEELISLYREHGDFTALEHLLYRHRT